MAKQIWSLNATFHQLDVLQSKGYTFDERPYKLRQRRLMSIIAHDERAQRHKRGLLDIGGSILHALFGVATTAQLARFNTALNELADNQQAIAHAHNALATVVNQTRIFSEQIAVKQQELQEHMTQMDQAVKELADTLNKHTTRLNRVELMSNLDHYFDMLELTAEAYADQVNLYHHQRSEIETSHLTRDLLSPRQLQDILHQASSKHSVIGQLSWYYQYLTVTPMFAPQGALLYKLEVPIISPRPYLLYHIATFPVPIANSSYTVTVNTHAHYATNTVTASIVRPEKCMGHAPSVCVTGPEFDETMQLCARGLLTHRRSLLQHCKVDVYKYSGTTAISMIDTNIYALSSQGETVSLRCPGQIEQHQSIPRGVFNLTCHKSCILAGSGWSVTCIDELFMERLYTPPIIQAPSHFNFSTKLRAEAIEVALPELKAIDARPSLDIPVRALLFPKDIPRPLISHQTTHVFTWFNLSLLFILIVILTVIAYRGRHVLCTRLAQACRRRAPRDLALAPTAPAPQTPHIYPLLPINLPKLEVPSPNPAEE